MFWLDLLQPLADLSDAGLESRLEELAWQTFEHPNDGAKMYDVRTLRERLWWVKLANTVKIRDEWRKLECEPAAARNGLG